ncbi:hypothetical protein MHH81_01720 [Psychrobacillus sp. FSL H8-0484]|uniref:hypothetical protein n=1 Tax=Psychrobacillus sp. FSL H8-0484 TaxID=2921390 RepID=UPI0030FD1D98
MRTDAKSIETKVSSISDEEYGKIGVTKFKSKQEDFKLLIFTFKMEHTDAVTNREV